MHHFLTFYLGTCYVGLCHKLAICGTCCCLCKFLMCPATTSATCNLCTIQHCAGFYLCAAIPVHSLACSVCALFNYCTLWFILYFVYLFTCALKPYSHLCTYYLVRLFNLYPPATLFG